jgi:hypothetical protein
MTTNPSASELSINTVAPFPFSNWKVPSDTHSPSTGGFFR